jgi:hypothetical protein
MISPTVCQVARVTRTRAEGEDSTLTRKAYARAAASGNVPRASRRQPASIGTCGCTACGAA